MRRTYFVVSKKRGPTLSCVVRNNQFLFDGLFTSLLVDDRCSHFLHKFCDPNFLMLFNVFLSLHKLRKGRRQCQLENGDLNLQKEEVLSFATKVLGIGPWIIFFRKRLKVHILETYSILMIWNQTQFQAIISTYSPIQNCNFYLSSLMQLQNGWTNELIGSTYLTNTLLANI